MSNQESYEFRMYCRNATDRQLIEIRDKERQAGRHDFAYIANAEIARRGGSIS